MIGRFCWALFIVLLTGLTPPWLLVIGESASGQGAGPIGRPLGGGNLPQDLDTITTGITAAATQTQAAATLCTTTICVVNTVAASGNGVALRQCTLAPMRQLLVNAGANSMTVYGSGTDTINGVATATGVTQAKVTSTLQSGVIEYVCTNGGPAATWVTH